ncbi:MAG: flagellar hook-basal body complex protein FliE [Desulfobulbus sp.]|jgi:flagellar hook-basal body complex protein FliE
MNTIQPINMPTLLPSAPAQTSPSAQASASFGTLLRNMVDQVNQKQQNADLAVQKIHGGGEKNLHDAMIAMEKADLSLRYMVQVRNKAVEAYQEIMRMQV